jgi:hypothetical protein
LFIGCADAEHWIILDDFMSALDHEVEAADVSEGSPAVLRVRPIEEFKTQTVVPRAETAAMLFLELLALDQSLAEKPSGQAIDLRPQRKSAYSFP